MAQAAQTTEQLEKVFETFNRVSEELDISYRVLQVRVSTLTDELAEVRSQRLQELAEKERLASRLALLMTELPGGVSSYPAVNGSIALMAGRWRRSASGMHWDDRG